MGNAKSNFTFDSDDNFKEEDDFLYTKRMTLLLCGLHYDKEAQEKAKHLDEDLW